MNQIKSEGVVTWQSPSNIAIVKYWGKHGLQLPKNPSFSLTLSAAYTKTTAQYIIHQSEQKNNVTVSLDGVEQPAFIPKITQFIDRISGDYPFLKQMELHLDTHNSFPHSSGIASSASAMSALALIIADIGGRRSDLREISRMSRLGSGSASRSIFPYGSIWGISDAVPDSSDFFGIGMEDSMHPIFKTFCDAILIVKSGKKAVSSTAGHGLMASHPFAETRYANARNRLSRLTKALEIGDVKTFGDICEKEALELHALMMCSDPPYILMEPETIEMIQRVQKFRKTSGIHVYFTLDAGPNLHLLYPVEHRNKVSAFIQNELIQYCENGRWIDDAVGVGPKKIV